MHAIVCIKQVPDSSEMRVDPETGRMQRAGVPSVINPHDVHAIEAALRLKDQFGGKVHVISMGPPFFQWALRKAVSQGVDHTYLVSDRYLAGADTYATSYALAAGIRRIVEEEGPFDIIVCGRQTIDGDTAQVGPGIAARLNIPSLTYIINIPVFDLDKGEIVVERKLEQARQTVRSKLPALITVEKELNKPRYASLPNVMRAADHEPTVWNVEALGLEQERCGLRGSPTIVAKSYSPPPVEVESQVFDGLEDPAEAATRVAEGLLGEEEFRYVMGLDA